MAAEGVLSSLPQPWALHGVLTAWPPALVRALEGNAVWGTCCPEELEEATITRREFFPGPRLCDSRCQSVRSAEQASLWPKLGPGLCHWREELGNVWTSKLLLWENPASPQTHIVG